jgi:hypothetical protein
LSSSADTRTLYFSTISEIIRQTHYTTQIKKTSFQTYSRNAKGNSNEILIACCLSTLQCMCFVSASVMFWAQQAIHS